jgi:flagellar basal-body rod protein FlgG
MSLRALAIAAGGGRALLQQIDLISANIAGAQLAGYKRTRATFADLVGGGVRLQSTEKLLDQGKLQATQRELDLAIEGEGFFRVLLPDQTVAYTRAGNLKLDPEGNLTTADGYLIDPPVLIPPGMSKIVIDSTGLMHDQDGDPIGQIELTRFANPAGLQSFGTTLFRETEAAGEKVDGVGVVRQGHLEQSNVDPMRELADLIQAQRAFELNSRLMQAADEILQSVSNLRRKS